MSRLSLSGSMFVRRRSALMTIAVLLTATCGLFVFGAEPETEKTAVSVPADTDAPKELFTGKVVRLSEAFERRKIRAYPEHKDQVALETAEGELIPIVSDWRGRAFFQDERLRDRKVQLVGTRPKGTPYLQVLMIFTFDEDGERQYTDYWCDICSIPMYEIKPCDCCQGDVRLRFQPQDLPEYVRE